jgi:hypothetical protein
VKNRKLPEAAKQEKHRWLKELSAFPRQKMTEF